MNRYRRQIFDHHRRLKPRDWSVMRDPRPRWALKYRGQFGEQLHFIRPPYFKRNRPRIKQPDRNSTDFILFNVGSWRAREETWPSLKYSW